MARGPVVATLPAEECVFRLIELPSLQLGGREAIASLRWELQRILPFPVDEGVFDFVSLADGRTGDPAGDGPSRLRYAVSGARLEAVDARMAALRQLGVRPAVLEPEWVTLWRIALELRPPGAASGVLDLGESGSRLMVVDPDGVPFAFHRSRVGGRLLTEELASAIGVAPAEAENLKISEFAEDLGPLATGAALGELAGDLVRALRRVQQEFSSGPVEMWAVGGGALWPALRTALSEALALELRRPGTPEAAARSPVGALDPRWVLAGELARWYAARARRGEAVSEEEGLRQAVTAEKGAPGR